MLKLVQITKDYKVADSKVHALKGIDLEFRKNEFVAILGASGCGKTTLLNIIGGLDHYTSGDLVIEGKSTKDFKDRDWDVYRNHKIGFIFQSYNLIPHQTVLGNVELALTIAGVTKEERKKRAEEALKRVGLGEELHKRPNQLSGGQMQRVAIARALVNNPAILLADEPTGALDSKTSVQIMDLIREISGERLVIMVTHNPELAEGYASRTICLKDGRVESDSKPYHAEEEKTPAEAEITPVSPAQEAEEGQTAEEGQAMESERKTKAPRKKTKMGFFTALALSFRNLLTKKGRTIITSVAGSIGIISVCLVLALSNGFNNYIKRTEEDMLSYYPVRISESAFDMTSMMASFTSAGNMPDMSELDNKVYVDSFLTNLANGMTVRNDVTEQYVDYIESMDKSYYSEIQYGYGMGVTDNLFTSVETGDLTFEGTNVPAQTRYMSLSALKTFYITELETYAPQYSALVPFADYFGNIVSRMPGTTKEDFEAEKYGEYVLSQYDVVKGNFPKHANEAVLVIGDNNNVTDLTLAQLGLLPEKDFLTLFALGGENAGEKEDEYQTIDFSSVVGKEYVLFGNDSVYEDTEGYMPGTGYPFTYKGEKQSLSVGDGEGIRVTVSGILRLKSELTYGCLSSGLCITEEVATDYIHMNQQSKLVKHMQTYSFPGTTDSGDYTVYYNVPAKNLESYYSSELPTTLPPQLAMFAGAPCTYEDRVFRYVGGDDSPNSISIYATDFDGKDAMLAYLDDWNKMCDEGKEYGGVVLGEGQKINYTDTVGLLMTMMQTMLDVITYVLVAFTAISLVVSSVMIGIITYVSVVERVKEIGVLRSLGARKQDIRNLFNAETFMIGLAAGLFGIVVTYLLSIVINVVLVALTGIAGICSLPPLTAFIMVVVSVALTLVSGLIPAQAAAKKDPVIALRTE